jgi:hypothetical protein
MLLRLVLWGFLIYAGWRRFPWWTPLASFAITVPVLIFQSYGVNTWRLEPRLRAYSASEIALSSALALATYLVGFWFGRGVAQMASSRRRKSLQPAEPVDTIDLTSGDHPLPPRQLTPEALIEQARNIGAAFPFKDNASAFGYACKFLNCALTPGAMLPALVQDGRPIFGIHETIHRKADGTQTAFLKVASSDGGFLVLATTTGEGPLLEPGDLVGWLAGEYSPDLGDIAPDKRFGWVGLIVGTLRPEWRDGSWIGQERFGTS